VAAALLDNDSICLQVYDALRFVDSLLEPAKREIYLGRLFGRPFYFPRVFASLLCLGERRQFPLKRLQRLCHAVRRVARVQLSLISLFEDRVSDEVVAVLRSSFPEHLLSCLISSTAAVVEARTLHAGPTVFCSCPHEQSEASRVGLSVC
jgi:hypothetical protein